MMWYTAYLLVLSVTCTTFAKNIPEGWPSCKRNDPNLNACLLAATDTMRNILVTKGAKEFGFPTLSSFILPEVQIQQEINKNIIIDVTSTNISMEGLETYKFTEFSYNPNTFKWIAKVGFDHLNMIGGMEFNGKLFGNDIKEKGHGTVSINQPKADFTMNGKLITKKGKEYYQVENAKVKLHIDPKSVSIKDVTGASPGIIKTINGFLADDDGTNLGAILKAAEEVVGNIVKSLIGNIPEKVPYNKLFPLA